MLFLSYMDLKFELYYIDFFYHSKNHLSFYAISYHFPQISNFGKHVVNFCLFYDVLVFGLVQFIVPCWSMVGLCKKQFGLVWF